MKGCCCKELVSIAHLTLYSAAGFDLFLGEDVYARLEDTLDNSDRLSLQQHIPTEELYWILWEPDAQADFAGWREWLRRVSEVRRRLGIAAAGGDWEGET